MEDRELLQYALEHGMIDLSYVQEQVEMNKREEILKEHRFAVWYNEKEGRWYTDVPDPESRNGKKRIKRKSRKDLDDEIVNHTLAHRRNEEIDKKQGMQLRELFYEFMDYKRNEVGSGTVKRMMADWKRFYEPNADFVHSRFDKITKIDIDNFFNSIMDEHKP